jgi:hypothetical protein
LVYLSFDFVPLTHSENAFRCPFPNYQVRGGCSNLVRVGFLLAASVWASPCRPSYSLDVPLGMAAAFIRFIRRAMPAHYPDIGKAL